MSKKPIGKKLPRVAEKLPYLGCNTSSPYECCGDRRFGCCDASSTRFSPAGPAVLTKEWDIGDRPCAGNLKKCTGKCGNNYCSMTGKCDASDYPYVSEQYVSRREPFSNDYYNPSAVGVGAGKL